MFILKGNSQFIFLCNPEKPDASQVCISFPQITQKILTEYIFHQLELIPEILSFLQILGVRKTTTQLFNISENLLQNHQQKTIILVYFGPLQILQIIHVATYSVLPLPVTYNCLFCMFSTIHSYLSLLLFHFIFLFSPSFFYSSYQETHFVIYNA